MAVEKWRAVVGWEGFYEVSDRGRARSLDRAVQTRGRGLRHLRGRILKQGLVGRAPYLYFGVGLSHRGRRVSIAVHLLVLQAFRGPRPHGYVACHGPRGSRINTFDNLSWGTLSKNNGADRVRDGTTLRGAAAHHTKLTQEQVREIRRLAIEGASLRELGRKFGVHRTSVRSIVRGESWAWLP